MQWSGEIPPVTLVEFILASYNRQDFYDISFVDGFNLPVSVMPQDGSRDCKAASCPHDVKFEQSLSSKFFSSWFRWS
jgi:hypothetical protein